MSKDLYLLRHAMANEKESGQKDMDRFLASQGIQVATKIGHHFKQEGIQPDMIISSPAVRAVATATLIAEQLKYNTDLVHLNDELYEASVRTVLQVVNRLKNEWNKVFIVTHNPSVSYLAEYITQAEVGSIVPGGYVHIRFSKDDWAQISEGNSELVEYKDPTKLDY